MKNVMVLSNWYHPVMGGPSTVIDSYLQYLKKEYLFHIITKTNEYKYEENKDFDVQYIMSIRHHIFQWCLYNIKYNKHYILARIILFIIRVSMILQTQYSFPTERKWEIKAYFNLMEKNYKRNPFSTIIAVSENFVIQIAALKFKKAHPEVKWISFILDPYSEFNIYYVRKLFKKKWKRANLNKEKEIYNIADICLFTPEMRNYVEKTFDLNPNKVFTIHYSLNKQLEAFPSISNHSVCRLVYAGMVYKDIRNPEFALSVLSRLKNIQLDLYIKERSGCEDILSKYNSKSINRYFFVDRGQYANMIRNYYDILINIGNLSSLQSPSKTSELLSTGKPIINFYFTKDSQYEMIEKYPLGINIKNEEYGAVEKVSKFCEEMKGKVISFDEVEKLYPDNNLQRQVELLRHLIES